MLIKPADEKSSRLRLLQTLQQREGLDARQRNWLCVERWRAEPTTNFLSAFEASENHAVLHDLRLETQGEVVEIDHLLIDRTMTFFVIDSHAFHADLHISPYGEFWAEYAGARRFVIDSPLARSRTNAAALQRVLVQSGVEGRMKMPPVCVPLVVANMRSKITRPDPEAFDTRAVLWTEQFAHWYERYLTRFDPRAMLHAFINGASSEEVKRWAELLLAAHRPTDPLSVPEFIGGD